MPSTPYRPHDALELIAAFLTIPIGLTPTTVETESAFVWWLFYGSVTIVGLSNLYYVFQGLMAPH